MDFLAFDVETACAKKQSICSIGITLVKNSQIVYCKEFLINPETQFDPHCVNVHGITAESVEGAPCFPEVWENIKGWFAHYPIVAHNATFERSALEKTAARYHIKLPTILYYDTLKIAKENLDLPDYKLPTVADYFGIALENHHNAVDDSGCAAEIMLKFSENESYAIAPLESEPKKQEEPHRVSYYAYTASKKEKEMVQPDLDYWDGEIIFFGKSFVFTGELPGMEREEAAQTVEQLGGKAASGVSRRTNYLVVGLEDMGIVRSSSGKSSKIKKAEEIIQQGGELKIISAASFLSALPPI